MAQDSTSTNETLRSLDDYVLLGRSGLRISPLCLGTMTFGEKFKFGSNYENSKEVFDYYYEKGGNFFDTANLYNLGESERFLGEYIADKRSQVVIATKYTSNTSTMIPNAKFNPNAGGNHRKSLVENLDESLKRLGTGYVDIMYVHIWEFRTPTEEVIRSLDDVIRSGKALYIAISDTPAWVISQANTIAGLRGWSRFIGLQTRYNLLDRSMEYDLQSVCAEFDVRKTNKSFELYPKVGIVPWGCIAEGFLTGKHTRESVTNEEKIGGRSYSISKLANVERNWEILDEVKAIASEINRSPVQVALNWVSQKPGVTSPLIGARTKAQLVENLKALEFKLTPEQLARLDAVSAPKDIPFPYSFFAQTNQFIGKNIQMPDKFKPMLNISK
ncbi:3947_t:CDS:10 [Dentiscutata heterogama]|uniref:3947_t:CDS:1 n=1 Tax=Dentiscutata heterogama TaxID=1316150 RepID=A0ACA9K6R2_9GLOM|nr:3947_t:CDS:10 [Dentiscutata heterogama]